MFLGQSRLIRARLRRAPLLPAWTARCFSVGHFKGESTNKKRVPNPHKPPPLGNANNANEESSPTNTVGDGKEPKKSRFEKMKTLFHEYKYPFIAYYGIAYITPIFPFYFGLQFFGVDGVEVLKWVGVQNIYEGVNDWSTEWVNLFIAGEMNEVLEFGRLPLVLATTPRVAKWWRSRNNMDDTPKDNK